MRRARPPASKPGRSPAASAAGRLSRASLMLGSLGVLSAVFVLVRLLESWHVTTHTASHRVSILGQALSYPTANAAAIVLIALSGLGLIVTARVVRGTLGELAANRRLHRRLDRPEPRLLHGAVVLEDARPRAFCAGLLRPRVYISTGALALLDDAGLDAVLAHERHHALRRDPLRLAAGRVLARALFMVPGVGELIRRERALSELSADESAVAAASANRSALARAMLSFSQAAGSSGIDPTRVDHLLGELPTWRFPLALCVGAAAAIALVVAIAQLAAQVAYGAATLAPPFLSRQPCVVVLAAIPAAVAFVAAACRCRSSEPGGQQADRHQRERN